MTKKPLNLLVDDELVKKARNHGIVLSRFLENKLEEYFSFIDAVSKTSTPNLSEKHYIKSVNEPRANNHDTNTYNSQSMDWVGFEPTASTLRRWRSSADLPALLTTE